MDTSLSWIKAYVPELDVTAQEYTDAMTLSGTKVEGFTKLDADLDKIVVGQIEKIEKHPDADKLIICQVNVGTETVQIVTGAPNVKEGDKVPVVLDGGRVAGGHEPGQRVEGGIKIKKRKTPWSRQLRNDVFHRRTWFRQKYVPGSTGIWNLHF